MTEEVGGGFDISDIRDEFKDELEEDVEAVVGSLDNTNKIIS